MHEDDDDDGYEDDDMIYLVQIHDPSAYGHWRKIRVASPYTTSGEKLWSVNHPFGSMGDAVEGIKEWRHIMRSSSSVAQKHPTRIIEKPSGRVVWSEYTPAGEEGTTNMENPIQLAKPLVLKKEPVLAKLKSNLKKEADKREEAEQKEKDARNDFRQFLLDHEEQVVNYIKQCIDGGTWKSALETAEEIFDKWEQYKTPESKHGRLEDELEKFVRVLEMSAEDTIEVTPSKAIYDLL